MKRIVIICSPGGHASERRSWSCFFYILACIALVPLGHGLRIEAAPPDASVTDTQLLLTGTPAAAASVLRSLGKRGDLHHYGIIIDTINHRPEEEVKTAGLAALELLPYSPEFLLEILSNSAQSSLARAYATYILGRMRSPAAVPALIHALNDPDAKVREYAITALAKSGDARAFNALIIRAHKETNETLRSSAERAAESLAASVSSAQDDPEVLVLQLKSLEVQKRRDAATRLARAGDWWSILPLCDALSDSDVEVRRLAAIALGDLQDRRAVPALVSSLGTAGGVVRQTTLIAIGVLKDDSVVPALIPYLSDVDPNTRKMTARALALLANPDAGPELVHGLTDIVPENRREVARALGMVRYANGIVPLTELIKRDIEPNQIEAIRAIGRIGTRESIPVLEALLTDKNAVLAITAVAALQETGLDEAIPLLERTARRHADTYVREEALEASIQLKAKRKASGGDVAPAN